MKYHHPMGFKKWKLTYMSWFSRHLLLFLKMQQVVYWWACSEEKDELELWLDHTNILHNGLRLRLWCRDVTSDSVFLSISHMTWTSSYPQVCISSWSFKSPAPEENKSKGTNALVNLQSYCFYFTEHAGKSYYISHFLKHAAEKWFQVSTLYFWIHDL